MDGELKGWGGYRHGRRSSIHIVQLHVRVPSSTHLTLKKKAEDKGVSMGELLELIVKNWEQTSK